MIYGTPRISIVAACLSSIIYGLSSASNGIGSSGVLGICVQPVTIIVAGWTHMPFGLRSLGS